MIEVKFHKEDKGLARMYFKDRSKNLYCVQPDHNNNPQMHACSKDGEPDYIVPANNFVVVERFTQ
jgi:hypothetical protein